MTDPYWTRLKKLHKGWNYDGVPMPKPLTQEQLAAIEKVIEIVNKPKGDATKHPKRPYTWPGKKEKWK